MKPNHLLPTLLAIACLIPAVPVNGMARLQKLPRLARMACEMALKLPTSTICTLPINTCPNDERRRSFATLSEMPPEKDDFGPFSERRRTAISKWQDPEQKLSRRFSTMSYANARTKLCTLIDEIIHHPSAATHQQILTIIKTLDDYDRLTRPEEEILGNWLGAKGYGKEIDYVQDTALVFDHMMKNPTYADAVRKNLNLRIQTGGKPFFDWMVTCWYSPKFAVELTQTAIAKLATSFEKDKNKLTNDIVMVQHLLQAVLSLDPETMAVKKCIGFECFMPSDNRYPNEYRDDQARCATIRACLLLLQKGVAGILDRFEQDFQDVEQEFVQDFLGHCEQNSQRLPNEWGRFAQSIIMHRGVMKAIHREQYEQKFNAISSLQDIYRTCAMALELLPATSA